jgi:acyl carrier protein
MNEKEFLANLEELFESDPGSLSLEQILADTGKWDSLNFVSFLAMAHSKYEVRVAPANLKNCKTIGDLFILVSPK